MAFLQNVAVIDSLTEEWTYDDGNGIEHLVTFKQDMNNFWDQEEFLNLEEHLNLSKSPISNIICEKLTYIENIKIIYKKLSAFTLTFPDTKGIYASVVFRMIKHEITFMSSETSTQTIEAQKLEAFHKALNFLEKMKFVINTGSNKFRCTSNLDIDNILKNII